ncbi:MAG: LLM class flavin-dependent oxidoreductase, partial [Actinomycetota bacterium]|nr:LLM class flavin-dependent oxidoreductase [Actinomycetota bacterium]
LAGEFWSASLATEVWPSHGVGELTRPLQQPHPPLAMAMASPGGATAELIAEKSMIPISANFVPIDFARAQWESYAAKRDELGLVADPSIWRVCRNILVTESEAQADDILADPDGVFGHYFRYLRGVAKMTRFDQEQSIEVLNEELGVQKALDACVIAGTAEHVTERLIAMADITGPFGTLVAVGHDADGTDLWENSIRSLAQDVAPAVGQHVGQL